MVGDADESLETIAVVAAPVAVQELAAEAAVAVLAVLVGPEVADLARRRGHLISGALAAVCEGASARQPPVSSVA